MVETIYFPSELRSRPEFNSKFFELKDYLTQELGVIKKPLAYYENGRFFMIKVSFIVEKDGAISGVSLGAYAKELDELSRQKIIETFEKNA